ncbi:hypothetical protein TREMEDRAFT_63769 [Tremella mesenterica DSM 1558]|uniref:uncharacterized protein n=1 Tax=Tremella mesenterica (strain ATCC 24925 / CBS 8224 / DSM 1558 / NBRC 9311 / NRRL Y-6157 / RJB 2259-6 / UBC 559-6) TaxID=578456 RepID=UPI0003F48C3F|nr:uncharacterized protein TREMEDRAFT_63769 [Tremella mesenterica DSM 1558]EIW67877.1 hypothetical protein TREMEDRAFT_63769 [Tremella mesenterica DSM 1558]
MTRQSLIHVQTTFSQEDLCPPYSPLDPHPRLDLHDNTNQALLSLRNDSHVTTPDLHTADLYTNDLHSFHRSPQNHDNPLLPHNPHLLISSHTSLQTHEQTNQHLTNLTPEQNMNPPTYTPVPNDRDNYALFLLRHNLRQHRSNIRPVLRITTPTQPSPLSLHDSHLPSNRPTPTNIQHSHMMVMGEEQMVAINGEVQNDVWVHQHHEVRRDMEGEQEIIVGSEGIDLNLSTLPPSPQLSNALRDLRHSRDPSKWGSRRSRRFVDSEEEEWTGMGGWFKWMFSLLAPPVDLRGPGVGPIGGYGMFAI